MQNARKSSTFNPPFVKHSKALQEAVHFKEQRVAILSTDPSSRWFVTWFVVSCYFPVVTACLGPMSNMISVACAVDHWRIDSVTHKQVNDPGGIRTLNVISLVLGIIANIVLLLHFSGILTYLVAQFICITTWSIAAIILLIAVVVCSKNDFLPQHEKSIGFWYAVITVCLYFLCSSTLLIHLCGYFKKKYPPMFNLMDNERTVMTFTFILAIWFFWGSALFSQLLDITYGTALFFTVVSVLTIGLGDIAPSSVASRIMILVYSFSGVIILGLIIVMTRGIIQSSSGPIFFFYSVENQRSKLYEQQLHNPDYCLSDEGAFDAIKSIRKRSRKRQRRNSIFITLLTFVLFTVLGSLVLYFAERWDYFECLYFCLLSVITIGYGDLSPTTGCGRAFYVVWCLAAVPLMTVLISTVGDSLYEMSKSIDANIGGYIYLKRFTQMSKQAFSKIIRQFIKTRRRSNSVIVADIERGTVQTPMDIIYESNTEDAADDLTDDVSDDVSDDRTNQGEQQGPSDVSSTAYSRPDSAVNSRLAKINQIKELLSDLKELDEMSDLKKNYEFSHDQWVNYLRMDSKMNVENGNLFWLSDASPLRYPLKESVYIEYKIFGMIEETLDKLLEDVQDYDKKLHKE